MEFSLKVKDSHDVTSLDTDKSKIPITITCNQDEEKTVKKVREQLNQVFSIADSYGWRHFSFGLNKWLSGDNTLLQLDQNWLKQVSLFKDAVTENKIMLETMPIGSGPNKGESLLKTISEVSRDGKPRTFADKWDSAVSTPLPLPYRNTATQDFAVTVGSFQVTTMGTFVVSKELNGQISIKADATDTITQKINGVKQPYDEFDFNSGDVFPPYYLRWIPDIPTIVFDELNLLKKCAGANDYPQAGQLKEEASIKGPSSNLIDKITNLKGLLNWKYK